MSHADQNYIVFCRIEGIKDAPTDLVAASVEVLAQVVTKSLLSASSAAGPLKQYSSVYGRLVVVPGQVKTALELAKKILSDATKDGVSPCRGSRRRKSGYHAGYSRPQYRRRGGQSRQPASPISLTEKGRSQWSLMRRAML